jgi:hypothetical protein
MKNILIILTLFIGLFLNAEENQKTENKPTYPSNNLITKVFSKSPTVTTESNVVNLKNMMIYVDEQKYFSPYKKHLVKNLSMLNYKAILMVDNDAELKKIASYIFPLSMCAAYQFRDDLIRIMQETSSFYVKTEEENNTYFKAFEKMGNLYLKEAQENFQPDNNFFIKKCSK